MWRIGFAVWGVLVCLLRCGAPAHGYGRFAAGRGGATTDEEAGVVFQRQNAIIYPRRTVVLSSQASGVIVKMPVEEQDIISAGQPIAQLDDTEARLSVERLRLAVAEEHSVGEAQIRLDQARDDFEAARKLRESKTISPSDFRSAERKYKLAQVIVDRARYQKALTRIDLKRAEKQLADRRIVAPLDGVVLKKHREVGESVDADAQTPVVTLIDVSRLRAEVLTPVEKIADMRLGQPATVVCNIFPQRTIQATVVFIEPVVHPEVDQFKIKVEFTDPTKQVHPGMRATVRILGAK